MAVQDVLNSVLEALKPQVEVLVKAAIEAKSDEVVELALTKLVELIPGKLDDAILLPLKPKIKEEVKKLLLAGADKISTQV